jgi:hypothetical protein
MKVKGNKATERKEDIKCIQRERKIGEKLINKYIFFPAHKRNKTVTKDNFSKGSPNVLATT